MPLPLSQLVRKLFLRESPGAPITVPGLLWEAPLEVKDAAQHWEMTNAGDKAQRPSAGEPLVFFVEKVPGLNNPFSMGVTIGRIESNDVVLDDGSVSRFHAWLQYDERAGQWSLSDAESKNGSWVDRVPVVPKQRVFLRDGAVIQIGDVLLTFMLPETLMVFLEERYRSS